MSLCLYAIVFGVIDLYCPRNVPLNLCPRKVLALCHRGSECVPSPRNSNCLNYNSGNVATRLNKPSVVYTPGRQWFRQLSVHALSWTDVWNGDKQVACTWCLQHGICGNCVLLLSSLNLSNLLSRALFLFLLLTWIRVMKWARHVARLKKVGKRRMFWFQATSLRDAFLRRRITWKRVLGCKLKGNRIAVFSEQGDESSM